LTFFYGQQVLKNTQQGRCIVLQKRAHFPLKFAHVHVHEFLHVCAYEKEPALVLQPIEQNVSASSAPTDDLGLSTVTVTVPWPAVTAGVSSTGGCLDADVKMMRERSAMSSLIEQTSSSGIFDFPDVII
jgi:hypothetical protein